MAAALRSRSDNVTNIGVLSFFSFLCAFAWAQPAPQEIRKMRVLAAHDYDPLADSVVGWKLQPGESITQSFRLPEGAMKVTGFRLRLRRNGVPAPIQYQLRSELGGAVLASGGYPSKRQIRGSSDGAEPILRSPSLRRHTGRITWNCGSRNHSAKTMLKCSAAPRRTLRIRDSCRAFVT